jgi:hypothetical protein
MNKKQIQMSKSKQKRLQNAGNRKGRSERNLLLWKPTRWKVFLDEKQQGIIRKWGFIK